MLDIARNLSASASLHALTGSSRPGAGRERGVSPAPSDGGLARRLDHVIAEHFGAADKADAEAVMIAGCTVVASHIARVPNPVARGVLLAQAQWTLQRVVAGVVQMAAGKGEPKGRDRRGP